MTQIINCGINLNKVDKSRIVTDKNGNKWLNIDIVSLKEPNQYGSTHSIAMQQTKEEREARTPRIYIGNGTEFKPSNPAENTATSSTQSNDDLPF